MDRSFAMHLLTLALLRLGRRDDAERQLAILLPEAEQSGHRISIHNALLLRSALATGSGRFAEGKAVSAEAEQRGGSHTMIVELAYAAQIVTGRMEQGRLDAVIAGLGGPRAGGTRQWAARLLDVLIGRVRGVGVCRASSVTSTPDPSIRTPRGVTIVLGGAARAWSPVTRRAGQGWAGCTCAVVKGSARFPAVSTARRSRATKLRTAVQAIARRQ